MRTIVPMFPCIFCIVSEVFIPANHLEIMGAETSPGGQVIQQRIMPRRELKRSRFSPRYLTDEESFEDLMDSLDNASGHLKLAGNRRDALIRVWFPEFKELTAPIS